MPFSSTWIALVSWPPMSSTVRVLGNIAWAPRPWQRISERICSFGERQRAGGRSRSRRWRACSSSSMQRASLDGVAQLGSGSSMVGQRARRPRRCARRSVAECRAEFSTSGSPCRTARRAAGRSDAPAPSRQASSSALRIVRLPARSRKKSLLRVALRLRTASPASSAIGRMIATTNRALRRPSASRISRSPPASSPRARAWRAGCGTAARGSAVRARSSPSARRARSEPRPPRPAIRAKRALISASPSATWQATS